MSLFFFSAESRHRRDGKIRGARTLVYSSALAPESHLRAAASA
jgi:hypothetical protein